MNHLGDTNKMVGEDHIRDATKMVSDTPRTDAAEYESQDEPVAKLGAVDADFARQLERELNAAQQRIKRLEQSAQEIDKEWFQVIESILGFHPVSMTEALRIGIERIKKQRQRIKRLEEALEGTVKWIVHLADSGDAGFWDVEKQSEIIAARAALKKEDK